MLYRLSYTPVRDLRCDPPGNAGLTAQRGGLHQGSIAAAHDTAPRLLIKTLITSRIVDTGVGKALTPQPA